MSKSPRFFLAAVLVITVLAVVLLLDRGPGPKADSGNLAVASPVLGMEAPNPVLAIEKNNPKPSRDEILTIRPFDFLSRKPLDLPELSLVSGEEVVELEKKPGTAPVAYTVPASLLERKETSWSWSYPVPFTTHTAPWRAFLTQYAPDKEGRVFLPFNGGVRGIVLHGGTRAPFENVKVKVFYLVPSNIEKLGRELDQDPKNSRETIRSLTFLLDSYEGRFGEVKKVEASTDRKGAFSIILPFSGQPTLQLYQRQNSVWTEAVQIQPGQWASIRKSLWRRPRIHGTVRNATGDRIPNIGVGITVLLQPESPDLPDRHSMRGFASFEYLEPSAGHAVVGAKLTVQTDRLGEYSAIFPRGNRYAAFAVSDSGSAFKEASVENLETFDELVLDLKVVPGARPFPLRFQFENGVLIVHAKVSIAIGGDEPWFRQFPALKTNSDGLVTIPWLESGTDYSLWVRSDQLTQIFPKYLKAGPTVITVPMKYIRTK